MKQELHICDRCGAEINIPKEKDVVERFIQKAGFKKNET